MPGEPESVAERDEETGEVKAVDGRPLVPEAPVRREPFDDLNLPSAPLTIDEIRRKQTDGLLLTEEEKVRLQFGK